MEKRSVGVVGGRGHVGHELVRVLAGHPSLALGFVASSTRAGERVDAHLPGAPPGLSFVDATPEAAAAEGADVFILALPNGAAGAWVTALERELPDAVIVDVSADHRFDPAWVWGLPELRRDRLPGARRVANPGCYATAVALAVAPLVPLLAAPPSAFGVSGYSGAGVTPSPRNDVEALRDNLMPYALVDHLHEREVSAHVAPVFFVPHVAPFFRGITVTVTFALRESLDSAALRARYQDAYGREPLIGLSDEPPLVRDAVDRPGVTIGGFAADPARRHAVVVVTLDNLLKGAASQAVQNINVALGLPELAGILPWPR